MHLSEDFSSGIKTIITRFLMFGAAGITNQWFEATTNADQCVRFTATSVVLNLFLFILIQCDIWTTKYKHDRLE